MADRRRALILSTGRDRGALAAARSLDRAGWLVGVGTPDGGGMPAASRACAARHVVARPRGDGAAFVADVRAAVRAGGYDVVFGGGDDWMAALATYRDQVPTRVAHPPAEVAAAALDKVALTRLALEVGFAAPRTEPATQTALDAWRGPVVVKCRAHWAHGQRAAHRIDARLFPGVDAARGQVERIRRAGGEPVLQQPVDGRLGALIGVYHDGRLWGRVQQTSTRLWPTPCGASARAQTVAVDPDLAARSEALLGRLGWTGLVELQFLTGDDGVPHLTDLNGRFYGSLALAEAARPGLVDLWARLVLGEAPRPLADGAAGVRYSWAAGDLRRARVERRGGLATDVLSTLRWAAGARHSVWRPGDLGPVGYLAAERLRPRGGAGSADAAGAPAAPAAAALPSAASAPAASAPAASAPAASAPAPAPSTERPALTRSLASS